MSNNNNIMTTTTNIVTPIAAPMTSREYSDTTNNIYMTFTGSPTMTTNWSNAYERLTTTESMANSSSTNTNQEDFRDSLGSLNITTNTTSSITNDTYNDLIGDNDDSEVLRTIAYIGTVLNLYYTPIIVGTGSIGNILSVFVFFRTKLRKLSSSFYLAALAVSDTCFLFVLFIQWLNCLDVRVYSRDYYCQFFTFFSSLACFCSVWFVVAFTVERFIAVMYPLRRQTMCTVRRAKMVLIGLTLLGCLHCTPFLIYSTPVYSPEREENICDIKSEYKDYMTLLNYWDTIVVFAVPFTTIAVLNTFTGCTVWKFATVRRTLTMQKMKTQHSPLQATMSSPSSSYSAAKESGAITTTTTTTIMSQQGTCRLTTSSLKRQKSLTCANGQQHNQIVAHHHQHNHHQLSHHQSEHHHQQHQLHTHSHPNRSTIIKHNATCANGDYDDVFSRKSRRRKVTNSSQLKVTKMLLIVSTVFVCLNLPSSVMRIITFLETQSSANEKTTVVLQYIFQLLFMTNFGINFVLYCVSGQNFRKAVLSMFRKVSTSQRDGTTQITVSEYYRNSGGISGTGGSNISTRRRMMSQNSWNEVHELQRLK